MLRVISFNEGTMGDVFLASLQFSVLPGFSDIALLL